jgi:hypothetical protein
MHAPSLYAHVMSGVLMAMSVLYLVVYSSKIISRDPYQILVLILLFSVGFGIHGISHACLEVVYGYNPLKLIGK